MFYYTFIGFLIAGIIAFEYMRTGEVLKHYWRDALVAFLFLPGVALFMVTLCLFFSIKFIAEVVRDAKV